jgi:hypothetical protein
MTLDELEREVSGQQAAPKAKKSDSPYAAQIEANALKYGVPLNIAMAVPQVESGMNPLATSPVGAKGLYQLMPATAADLGVQDPYNPDQNIEGGLKFLGSRLKARGGDIDKALADYNFGQGNVNNGKPYPKETKEYIEKVKKRAGIEASRSMTLDEIASELGLAGSHTYPTSQTGAAPGAGADLLQMGKQMALPTIGQVAGIGTGLLTGPAAPIAVPFFEAVGGMTGEYMNQRLGITEPSNLQIVAQGAVPLLFRGAAQAGRGLKQITPPTTKGAEFLNRIAGEEARLQMSKLAAPDAEALFQRAFESGAHFHTGGTMRAINNELANLTRGANADQLYGRTITVLRNLRNKLEETGGYLNPVHYQTELRDLGAALRTSEGRTVNKVEQSAIKQVYAQLAQALDREAIPRRGPAPRGFETITPEVMPDETAMTVYREPPTIFRGQQTGKPLQPNVPSTHVNLQGFQPSQPAVRQAGVPGVRQPDEIIPAQPGTQQAGPEVFVHPGQPRPGAGAQQPGTGNQNAMAAQDLLQARRYVKRRSVLDDIDESIGNAEKILRGQGDNVQFNGAAVLRDLKNNPFWTGEKGGHNPAFTPQEKQYVEDLFALLNKIPVLQPGAGVNAGSMRKMQRFGMAGTGAGAAGAFGGDPLMTGAAAAAGAAIPTLVSFWRVASLAMRTEVGREELLGTLRQATRQGMTLDNVLATLTGSGIAATASRPRSTAGPTAMPTPFSLEP